MKTLKKLIAGFVPSAVAFSPLVALAQGEGIFNILNLVGNVIVGLIPIILGLAVLMFLIGVFRYVVANGEDDKAKGRQFMIWGIVGLFVMVSVWGLVNLLSDTLRLNNVTPQSPRIPVPGNAN